VSSAEDCSGKPAMTMVSTETAMSCTRQPWRA
jgi:hypothetical protein